ncbi:SpoIIE family protein phosphatase [Streptomyces sp. NPDC046985]|uniref:SpoIIE family protein phosphatase n=1 Tax=Streptomyces sp. NPDC046985 TaxID=3155377 RepID=UPI0033FB8B2E
MANVVSEGATARGARTAQAELALRTLAHGPPASGRARRVLEQALVFAGAAFAGLYFLGLSGDTLLLAESAGVPHTLYGLREDYPLAGGAATAQALRLRRAVWLGPGESAARADADARAGNGAHPDDGTHADDGAHAGVGAHLDDGAHAGDGAYPDDSARAADADGRQPPVNGVSLAALPLPGPNGCLLAVTESPGGFDAEDRACLELIAGALGYPPSDETADAGELPPDAFRFAMDSGRVEAGDAVLALFGLGRAGFDGRVETLLALTVPEDLPALMSVVEADHMTVGDRELEFRVVQPHGPPRWLRLSARLLPGADGRPARLAGAVADASTLRSGGTDVARIQRLAAALATAGTVRDVSQAVVTALREPLRADRIALAELENDRLVFTVLVPAAPASWPDLWRQEWRAEWPDAPVRAMPTLAAALREGRTRIWPAGAALEPALAGVGPGGLAVLPLPAGGRTAGACLIGWNAPHDFGPDERALLTAAAGLAGQALIRAHAFDAEHELVGMLQRTLLPRRLPRLPGAEAVARYLPATAGLEVGGDWYDVIPLPDNHAALVIGDVQGHNAGAATLMGQMRTALRAYAAEGHPPDVVVSHANRLLLDMETDLFATCSYVDVDMEAGLAWCVRAGHLPPLLRRPDGRVETVEAEGGPPLGVLAEAEFPMTPLRLRPGAVLALATDGLVESPEADLDEGMNRFAEGLAAADPGRLGPVADALLTGARRDDDIALLLMRYDGLAVRPLRESWTVWRVPEAVRHARRFTRRVLRTWDVTADADAALLVVSELVTNALVHTEGQVRLDLTLVHRRLRIAVADTSPRAPVKPTSIGWEATGGRGVLLVEAVSGAWGSLPVSGGKQVWCELVLGR